VTLACAAGRMDAALHRFSIWPRGGGWGAAGEGRRRAGEDKCENQLGTCTRTAILRMPEQARSTLYVYAWLALACSALPRGLLGGIYLSHTCSAIPYPSGEVILSSRASASLCAR